LSQLHLNVSSIDASGGALSDLNSKAQALDVAVRLDTGKLPPEWAEYEHDPRSARLAQ